jgi:hypothetical protein
VKPGEKPVEVLEKDVQMEFEKNLSSLEEGLERVDSFVKIDVGIIDTLAVDSERRGVIIEFKKPDVSPRDGFVQALDYYAWVRDHPDWLTRYVKHRRPDLLPENQELEEEVRLVLVADEFDERLERAVRGAEPEVMLIEYSLHPTGEGKVQLIPQISLDTSVTPSLKARMPKTIDDHFKNKNTRPLFEVLLAKVREFAPEVQPAATRFYINLKVGYVGVVPAREHLTINARARTNDQRFREWPPPHSTSWGKPGEGGTIKVARKEELDESLMQWLRSAFEAARRP